MSPLDSGAAGAVLGGLLLNIMPCVFPILSLKALSLARGGASEREARHEALAYTAGVVLVCLGLGAAILALRAGGSAVGWAFQLQHPAAIVVLLLLSTMIAFNLAGLFEVPTPRFAGESGASGAFATGALAAFISDDIRHATGYLVIADGALVLLGFAALDPAAWGPTRVWLVALAASKTAVAAWSAVMEDRFGTRAIPDLRGWLRHSPILGAGLTVAAIASDVHCGSPANSRSASSPGFSSRTQPWLARRSKLANFARDGVSWRYTE